MIATVFSLLTYSYSVCWTPPTERADGSPLTNLAGYEVLRQASGPAWLVVATPAPGASCATVDAPQGSWRWAVVAIDAAGLRSDLSNIKVYFPGAGTGGDSDLDGITDALDNCQLAHNPEQVDSDADGYGNACDGDLNGDGATTSQDNVLFRARLGQPSDAPVYSPADLNANGSVNAQDFVLFRRLLGSPPGPSGIR